MLIKRIAALLAAMLLVIPLTACGGDETSDQAESEISIEESGEEISSPAPEPDKVSLTLDKEVDRTLPAKNIFSGLSYTISRPTNDTYVDDDTHKLTDGMTSDMFMASRFVAWDGAGAVTIDFDLGPEEHALADIEIGCLRVMSYGIGLPSTVEVLASFDGEEFVTLGKRMVPADVSDSEKVNYSFAFQGATSARFIKIKFGAQDNAFLFIDEIAGYEYSADGDLDRSLASAERDPGYYYDYYGEAFGKADVNISESDSDYNDIINLLSIKGTVVTAQHFDPISKTPMYNTESDLLDKMLHDGKYPQIAHYDDPNWVKFTAGGGRHIIADLGTDMAVTGYKTVFLDVVPAAVGVPRAVYISLSSDGKEWTTVYGEYNPDYGDRTRSRIYTLEADFDGEYKARYVRISFQTDIMVYMGEIEVYGRKNTANASAPKEDSSPYGKYPDAKEVGCDNILFAPLTDGYGRHMTSVNAITYDDALKYLAYWENGAPKDTFFDSVALSTRGELNSYPERFDGMTFYFEEIFDYDDTNMAALDKAKGYINDALGRDEKLKIWVSVNMAEKTHTFKGVTTDTVEKAVECLNWQADEIIKRFDEKGYENLELLGFYWQYESFSDNNDYEVITLFNEHIHSLGYKSFWCPWYNAPGIWQNHAAGFDITCLQPNYMFYDTTGFNRLTTTAELAKMYGMCVEIEIEDAFSKNSRDIYYEYLAEGMSTGYMNTVKAYYQGAMPGAIAAACASEDENVRILYDMTYKYAKAALSADDLKATLTNSIIGFESADVNVSSGGRSNVDLGDGFELMHYRVTSSPAHGTFRINIGGKVLYICDKDFIGTDELELEIAGFDGVKTIKITYIIEQKGQQE